MSTTRNTQIAKRYKAGETQEELRLAYGLTRGRIHQILKEQGITRADSPQSKRGHRYAFIGANVTEATKGKFHAKTKVAKKSMSRRVEELIEEDVK